MKNENSLKFKQKKINSRKKLKNFVAKYFLLKNRNKSTNHKFQPNHGLLHLFNHQM